MNQYQKFAMQMIEQFDALGDLTLLPNFAIRKMLLGFLVVEGLEIELARKLAMGFECKVSQEAYDSMGEEITAKLVHSMAKVIAKVNTASIANGLGPIQDAQGMNLNID